jgi:hypothetical protein
MSWDKYLWTGYQDSLSNESHSRIHFGIFRKQTGRSLSQFLCLLTHFSNSRTHDNYSCVIKVTQILPEFSQAD